MRQTLHRRLQQLEAERDRIRRFQAAQEKKDDGKSAIRKIELFLRLRGVEKGPVESLREAWARSLDIAARELDRLLAAGTDPIHKYFTDNGVYEAIEARKAAGPSAGG